MNNARDHQRKGKRDKVQLTCKMSHKIKDIHLAIYETVANQVHLVLNRSLNGCHFLIPDTTVSVVWCIVTPVRLDGAPHECLHHHNGKTTDGGVRTKHYLCCTDGKYDANMETANSNEVYDRTAFLVGCKSRTYCIHTMAQYDPCIMVTFQHQCRQNCVVLILFTCYYTVLGLHTAPQVINVCELG